MAGHECYHCRQWVEEGAAHDCWTTTEAALTAELSEELRDAWQRLRETAADFGEQRIYASHKSIMFSRTSCYFFVRPKRKHLELCIFLGRTLRAPQVKRAGRASRTKTFHIVHITHRDEVEAPITDWLRDAYQFSGTAAGARTSPQSPAAPRRKSKPRSKAGAKSRTAKRARRPRRS